MTRRNRFHTFLVTQVAYLLESWLRTQPAPCGEVHTGEAGAILRREPDSIVGIDVAYFSAETMDRQNAQTTMIDPVVASLGSPILGCQKTKSNARCAIVLLGWVL